MTDTFASHGATVAAVVIILSLSGLVIFSDLSSTLMTAAILGAATVVILQTTYLASNVDDPWRVVRQTALPWIGTVAVASPISRAGVRRPQRLLEWFLQTTGQGGSVAVIATIALVGVVRTVLTTGEHSGRTTPVERPTDRQLLGVVGVSVGALVGLAVSGPVIPAVFAAGTWGTALVSGGSTRLSAVAGGLVTTAVVIEAVVTGGVLSFVIAAVVTTVAVTLLPYSPARHAAFAVAMGFQIGLYLDLQTAQLSGVAPGSVLLPGGMFAGVTLLVSTVAAGLFHGPELIDRLRSFGRSDRSVSG